MSKQAKQTALFRGIYEFDDPNGVLLGARAPYEGSVDLFDGTMGVVRPKQYAPFIYKEQIADVLELFRKCIEIETNGSMNRMLLSFLFLFFFGTNVLGACFCLCSAFKTTGGERKICPTEPVPQKDGICKVWLHAVPHVNDHASCVALGEENNDCQGYFKDARNGDRWVEAFDGRYHSCRF